MGQRHQTQEVGPFSVRQLFEATGKMLPNTRRGDGARSISVDKCALESQRLSNATVQERTAVLRAPN